MSTLSPGRQANKLIFCILNQIETNQYSQLFWRLINNMNSISEIIITQDEMMINDEIYDMYDEMLIMLVITCYYEYTRNIR